MPKLMGRGLVGRDEERFSPAGRSLRRADRGVLQGKSDPAEAVYVSDRLNARIVRVGPSYAAEAACEVK